MTDEQPVSKTVRKATLEGTLLGLLFGGIGVVGYGLYLLLEPLAFVWIGVWMILLAFAVNEAHGDDSP